MAYRAPRIDTKPWYKYFWPWFIIGVFIWTLASGIGMLYFASKNVPSFDEDYSKLGKVYDDEANRRARQFGIRGKLSVNKGVVMITLSPLELQIGKSELKFIHPMDEKKDIIIPVATENNIITLSKSLDLTEGTWRVKFKDMEHNWAISGEVDYPQGMTTNLY
jgi:uncharacterized protein